MTDGYVGNDANIIAEIKKHSDARVFSFGIGTSVNRFLLTKMAEEGHGDVEFVTAPGEAQAAADRFYERVHSPVLTNISIDWNGLPVNDVYPRNVRDLFSAKPIIITGRYSGTPTGKITIKGYQGTGDYSRTIPVDFTSASENNAALEKIWARHKVEDLMSQDWNGIQWGNSKYKAQIIQVGLEHSLATQFTSFVAVEERTVVSDGKPMKVEVPVELPEGVSPLAVPGEISSKDALLHVPQPGLTMNYMASAPAPAKVGASSETVEVTADAPMVDTSSAQVTHTFSGTTLGTRDPVVEHGATGGSLRRLESKQDLKLAQAKLSPELLEIYRCTVAKGAGAEAQRCKALPRMLHISLSARNTPDIQQKLARAGFQQTGVSTGSVHLHLAGTIAPAKLKQLLEIEEVDSVSLKK
jgi:Ca-activated chloride channel family protein